MPVMDGYEACQAIREFEKDMSWRTSIVALTANAMASDEQKCLKAGMDAFLTKPIDQDYMVQIILRTMTPNFSGNSCTSSVKSSVQMDAPIQLQVSS
jgi:CheY-like chemotaxis protein